MFTITATNNPVSKRSAITVSGHSELAKQAHALTVYRDHGLEVVCWGDPAQSSDDSNIIQALLTGRKHQSWGRSWIAYNHFRRCLYTQTDTVGTFPVYMHKQDNSVTLASSRAGLLEHSPSLMLNPSVMRELVAFGQALDDRSIFKNVVQLPGRSQLLIDTKGHIHRQTEDAPILGHWKTKFEDGLEAFVEGIRTQVKLNPNVLVSLSGGLDSRLILAAVLAVGGKPTGLTYGDPRSTDVRIAKQLAQSCGIPLFTGKPLETEDCWKTFQRVAQLGSGEVPVHHAHAIMDSELLEQTAGRTLLTGTGAETYRAFYFDRGAPGFSLMALDQLRTKLMPKAKRYVIEEFSKTATPFFDIAPQYRESLLAKLDQRLNQVASHCSNAATFLDNVYLKHRVGRMVIAGQQMLDKTYFRSHPFLTKDALFYIGHLPVQYKLGSTFHRQAITRLSPKLASITWDKTGNSLANGLPIQHRYPALAARFGVNTWGKQSTPMFDYQSLLRQLPDAAVYRTLESLSCHANNPNQVDSLLSRAKQNRQLLGFSATWSCIGSDHTPFLAAHA